MKGIRFLIGHSTLPYSFSFRRAMSSLYKWASIPLIINKRLFFQYHQKNFSSCRNILILLYVYAHWNYLLLFGFWLLTSNSLKGTLYQNQFCHLNWHLPSRSLLLNSVHKRYLSSPYKHNHEHYTHMHNFTYLDNNKLFVEQRFWFGG